MSAAWHKMSLGASVLASLLAACGGAQGGTGETTGGAACAPGTSVSCTATCAAGMVASAVCTPAGKPGACACGAATVPGQTAGGGAVSTPGATAGRGQVGGPGVGATAGGAPVAAGVAGAGAASGGPGTVGPGMGGPATVVPDGRTYGSWTMMGYDQTNNYHNTQEKILSVANAPMLKEKWRAKVTGFPPGSPTIAQGRVFVQASGGTFAFALKDGMKLWERTDLSGTSSIAVEGNFVYIHTNPAELWKLDAATGKEVWGPVKTYQLADCDGESSPILAPGMVLVGHSCGPLEIGPGNVAAARGGVEAFDTETGMRKWTYYTVPESGENGAMVWSTVSVDLASKVVFAATGNNYSVQGENSDSMHAIDLMTGMRLWKTQVNTDDTWSLFNVPTGPDTDFGANPIIADIDGMQVVMDGNKGSEFFMFDRKTGDILWQRLDLSTSHNQSNGGVLMNGAFDGKYVYVVSNQPPGAAVLHALDPRQMGKDAWPPKNFAKLTWGAPSVANGVLVVPNDDDLLVMNAMTGEMLAMFNTGGTIAAGAAAIVDGNIVVKSGLQYELDASVKNNDQIICYAVPDAIAPDVGAGGVATGPTFVPGSPTFSAIYAEIIQASCGGPSCHSSSAGGGLVMQTKMDAYTALVNAKAMGMNVSASGANCADVGGMRVVPNDAANSLLVDKIENPTPKCGGHMPPGGMLTAAQLKQVRDWIMAGAMNN
ncbi:MAG TPA: PQQ-binding-like beta-propeller repeat protein [Polyangiales bacterium]|nr:PQQ-binding-like beta-propeller repeat protein [Polyangiales bacterium]